MLSIIVLCHQSTAIVCVCVCVCVSVREGVGAPLSVERTRMLLALRINVLAKGHSGVSLETLDAMIKAFNGISLFQQCIMQLYLHPSNTDI